MQRNTKYLLHGENICCPPVDQLADEAVPVAVLVLVAVRLHGDDLVFNAGDLHSSQHYLFFIYIFYLLQYFGNVYKQVHGISFIVL